jgi:hypothetical protein
LPHQLSGTLLDWIWWFVMFIPALSSVAGCLAWHMAKRYLADSPL